MAAKINPRKKLLAPGGKTIVIRIEVTHLNGIPFRHTLTNKDIKKIWTQALGLSSDLLLRQANYIGPNDTFRVNYRLAAPRYLLDVIKNPEFSYQIELASGSVDTYTGKVLDLDTI